MTDVVEYFLHEVLKEAGPHTRSNRALVIRNKITELENIISQRGAGLEHVQSALQQARDGAFRLITQHSPNKIPTPDAEFYQLVFDALSIRLLTAIQQQKNGTFQINIVRPGHVLPHVAKDGFVTEVAAQQWRDSDVGSAIISGIIYPK